MKNLIYRIVTGLVTVTLIGVFIFSLVYVKNVDTELKQITSSKGDNRKIPDYHFFVCANNLNSTSGQAFIKGIEEASEEYNVVVEYYNYDNQTIEENLQSIEIGIASNVDGIVTQAAKREDFKNAIDKAVDGNVPIVTVFEDAPTSKRYSFIGANSFELGKKAGAIAADALKGNGEIAIILDNVTGQNSLDTTKNLIETGFRDVINEYDFMEVEKVAVSNSLLEAEDIAKEIIYDNPDIDLIFCTSEKDTVGVAQVIVDLNKVGDVQIIGYGDHDKIIQYIKIGVMEASLVNNSREIGYKSIKAIVDVLEYGTTSTFIDTGVNIINKDNVTEYVEETEVIEGEQRP